LTKVGGGTVDKYQDWCCVGEKSVSEKRSHMVVGGGGGAIPGSDPVDIARMIDIVKKKKKRRSTRTSAAKRA
jgi:hypothetical protein